MEAHWTWAYLTVTTAVEDIVNSDEHRMSLYMKHCNSVSPLDRAVSFSMTYPRHPQLLQLNYLLDIIRDPVTRGLNGLSVHHSYHADIITDLTSSLLRLVQQNNSVREPRVIDVISDLASSFLCLLQKSGDNKNNNHNGSHVCVREARAFYIFQERKEDQQMRNNPSQFVKRLLADNDNCTIITAGNRRAVKACDSWCCTICHDDDDDDDDDDGELVKVKFSCSHVYHVDCIVEWIVKCGIDVTCPTCRSPLL